MKHTSLIWSTAICRLALAGGPHNLKSWKKKFKNN